MKAESNEVAVRQQSAPVQFNFFDNNHFATMQRVCGMFSSSELVPKMYQTSEVGKEKAVANCMIAVETAQRIGASPLMVMQNMYIVHGQPAWSAKFLTATVNGCGRYNSIKYKWENLGKLGKVEYTDYEYKNNRRVPVTKHFDASGLDNWQCIAYTTEKGTNEKLDSIPVSLEMAIKEGWYTKSGSKWQTMPKLMLQYRSVTFWTRAYAPELSMGIRTEDEVKDIIDVPYEEVKETEKKKNANQKEVSIPVNEPESSKSGKAEDTKESLSQVTVKSIDEAKKFLVDDLGVSQTAIGDEASILSIAKEHDIELTIEKQTGPGF
jgi:hypothetical protein